MRRLRSASLLPAALAAAVSIARPAAAQEHVAVTHQYQTWVALNYQGPLAGRLQLAGDVQYRAWDDLTPQAIIVRNALLYRLLDGMFVGAGYMWQPVWRARGFENFADEHRLYEVFQYTYTHAASGISVQLRTRFEQRFRHPEGDLEFGLRARQMVRAMAPLTSDRRLSLVAWDEVFFNLTDSGHEDAGLSANGAQTFTPQWEFSGFDQNRAFVGLAYQFIAGTLRAELGYMNQYVRRPNNPANGGDLMGHTTLLQVYLSWR
jgi:hypothetical protein